MRPDKKADLGYIIICFTSKKYDFVTGEPGNSGTGKARLGPPGPKGDQGAAGRTSAQGPQGAKGEKGQDGTGQSGGEVCSLGKNHMS